MPDTPMGNPLSKYMKPEESAGKEPAGDDMGDAAQDVLDAVKAGSADMLKGALHDFFTLCDKAPHAEGPHEDGEEPAEE